MAFISLRDRLNLSDDDRKSFNEMFYPKPPHASVLQPDVQTVEVEGLAREAHQRQSRPRSSHPRKAKRTSGGTGDDDGEEPADEGSGHGLVVTDLNDLPALLNIMETAALLRTTTNAIYTMAARGKLPGAVHIGRRLLVRRTDLVKFISEGRVPPPGRSR